MLLSLFAELIEGKRSSCGPSSHGNTRQEKASSAGWNRGKETEPNREQREQQLIVRVGAFLGTCLSVDHFPLKGRRPDRVERHPPEMRLAPHRESFAYFLLDHCDLGQLISGLHSHIVGEPLVVRAR